MKKIRVITLMAIVGAMVLNLSSCYKKFDPKSYQPPFTFNGYTSVAEIGAGSLVGYWAFNGSLIDSVSKVAGTAVNESAISFVPGFLGKAVQVKSPGYINSNVGNTIANLKSFTMVMWIQRPENLASGPDTYMPFSLNKAGYSWEQTKFFLLFEKESGSNSFGKIALMDQWFDKGRVWPKVMDAKWHQVAVSFDGNTGDMRVYVDGALLPESSNFKVNPQSNFGSVDSFTLGGPDANATSVNSWMNSLSGNLDEFRVYSKVLTASDLQAMIVLQGKGK